MSGIFGNILILCFIFSIFIISGNINTNAALNNRPIIGILSQELSPRINRITDGKYKYYIASSYVKFIEGAGARVVPIWIGKSETYYRNLLKKLNGVLLPGGSAYFNNSDGYADAGYKIYRIAKEMNNKGDYFPILGICLGFELMMYVAANKVKHRISCSSQSQALPLMFNSDYKNSRLFKMAPSDVRHILKTYDVTINFHMYCITKNALKRVELDHTFRIISENYDKNGVKFISSLEHVSKPFYGLQFHPEKNIYEWITGKNIPHSSKAIMASQYFANFFVNETRKNNHAFGNSTEESRRLIYNYQTFYTGIRGSSYEQVYLFPPIS